ncbi:conserved Plasmodium protein, unknown function [Plasmodium relictum]|uniref:Uncharacterized protein n=1 Tax=Plasmodium relictum TaxID=85471 RepID=A0A1J1HBB5_PLARL|nr:conserved Plasmodium protein, unknown function [Plasmodium relictum]CRH02365.1 conserved Plasmodium protein, unknown function [Plasmodium relictum]
MIGSDNNDEYVLKICKENANKDILDKSNANSCTCQNNEVIENFLEKEKLNYKNLFYHNNNSSYQSFNDKNFNQEKFKICFKRVKQDKKYSDNEFIEKPKNRIINKNGRNAKENIHFKKKENEDKKKLEEIKEKKKDIKEEEEEKKEEKKKVKKEEEEEKEEQKKDLKKEEEVVKITECNKFEKNEQMNINEMKENKQIQGKQEYNNEQIKNKFSVFHIGINKIEAIKALYRDCKNNFNKSFKEKINKLNSLIYFCNDNNFENHFSVDYINDTDKINSIKKERLSRLFLYIEDINKLKQAFKVKQHNNLEIEDNEKKEYFYDANEDIEDFFIFDDSFSCLNNEVESIFTESENTAFLKEDKGNDNFIEEGKDKSDEENNMLNIFTRFSLKNYYCFDINKNLCSIYAFTPMIIKKFAEKINSYNIIKSDKILNNTEEDNINFSLDCKNSDKFNYYSHYALDNSHNLDTYIQFHCDKWQENIYDIVEVNSIEFDFNCLKCNIM